jgi:hypothetical protein
LLLNLFVWAQASSTAIPFSTLIGLLALWLLIQVPLVYLGSWVGYVRATPWEHPLKTNAISRQIPPQPWYLRSPIGPIVTGLIPFAVLFIELLFVFKNLWQDKTGYYYVFGFLSVVSVVLMVTVVEVTVIATYSQLCSEVRSGLSQYSQAMLTLLELSLVVAELPHRWQQRILDFRVLHLVLPVQAPHHWFCFRPAVLQLLPPSLRRLRSLDRNCWVLGCLCLR